MGFNVNEGYYEKHVNKKGYKITDEQEKFNLADVNDIRKGIAIATAQWEKDMKNISKVHLKDRNIENLDRNGVRVSGGEER